MKKIAAAILVSVCFYFIASHSSVHALDCAPTGIEADGIITGLVKSVKSVKVNNTQQEVVVEVHKSYKAITDHSVKFTQDATWGTLEEGKEYLIFLDKENDGWKLPLCSSTLEVSASAENLAKLKGQELALSSPSEQILVEGDHKNNLVLPMILVVILLGFTFIIFRVFKKR